MFYKLIKHGGIFGVIIAYLLISGCDTNNMQINNTLQSPSKNSVKDKVKSVPGPSVKSAGAFAVTVFRDQPELHIVAVHSPELEFTITVPDEYFEDEEGEQGYINDAVFLGNVFNENNQLVHMDFLIHIDFGDQNNIFVVAHVPPNYNPSDGPGSISFGTAVDGFDTLKGFASNGDNIAFANSNRDITSVFMLKDGEVEVSEVYSEEDNNYEFGGPLVYDKSRNMYIAIEVNDQKTLQKSVVSMDGGKTWKVSIPYPIELSTPEGPLVVVPMYCGSTLLSLFYIPSVSGYSQIAFCQITDNMWLNCSTSTTTSFNPLVSMASLPNIVVAMDNQSNIMITHNLVDWTTTGNLGLMVGPDSMVTNNGMLYAVGVSTSSFGYKNSSGNKDILEVSENGLFWQNTAIPRFSNIYSTRDSYCAMENDSSDPAATGHVWCWGSNYLNKLGLGNLGLYESSYIPKLVGTRIL